MGDANLLDIRDDLLIYSYAVRGVEYTASQDISRLKAFLPGDLASLGPCLCEVRSAKPRQLHRAGRRVERAAMLAWTASARGLRHPCHLA